MTEGTDLVALDIDLAPAPVEGGALLTAGGHTPVASDPSHHPGPRQYVLIAIVLVILTGVEVATSYLDGHVNSSLLIVALGIMAAVKFFLVAAWYMHMKQDSATFRRLFLAGLILACTVYGVLLFVFSSTVLKS